MHALHIIGRTNGPIYLGKGSADPKVIRERLSPEMAVCEVWIGNPAESQTEMHLRYLMAYDILASLNMRPNDGWWPMRFQDAVESVKSARYSLGVKPNFKAFIVSLVEVRKMLGLDQATLAAMLDISRAKMSRLEAGRTGPITIEEFATLRYWAKRLGRGREFDAIFSLDAIDPGTRTNEAVELVMNTDTAIPPWPETKQSEEKKPS